VRDLTVNRVVGGSLVPYVNAGSGSSTPAPVACVFLWLDEIEDAYAQERSRTSDVHTALTTALRRVLMEDEYNDVLAFLSGVQDNEYGAEAGAEFGNALRVRLEESYTVGEKLTASTTDLYAVLGVDPSASTDAITAAYRRLAMQFHPDKHPAAREKERHQFEDAMSRINAAYAVLREPTERAAYDNGRVHQAGRAGHAGETRSRFHAPTSTQCMLCGGEPAEVFDFRYQHAFIFRGTRYGVGGVLCNECARSLGRSAQSRTLAAGWWGITAFFSNFLLAYRNAQQLYRVSRMAGSKRVDGDVVAPLLQPMPPGRSVFLRSSFLVALLVVGGVAAGVVNAGKNGNQPGTATTVAWEVGNCVDGAGDLVHPVDCSSSHVGRIEAAESASNLCPATTQRYVLSGSLYYCITLTTG
jgi:DnaJ-domain-containing protein 1